MPDEYWEKLQQIFHEAVVLKPGERSGFLDHACRGDESLRRKIDFMLRAHHDSLAFVDQPAFQAAAEMLVKRPGLQPGQIVSRYQILSLLGEGGMGRVYLAEDLTLKRKVALKFLSRNFTEDHARVQRFEQEARAISALNHPNILTIHEVGEADGEQFIAGEFVDGDTLRIRLANPLEIDDALDISIQIAAALVAAHRLNIVHRDIKPENIMIRREDGLVKVLDFGLAKIAVAAGSGDPVSHEATTLMGVQTQDGLLLGTVAYMSPEQARGSKVDERTDIWSMGAVLFEMIAGSPPFLAATSQETIAAILSKDPLPRLSRYRAFVPERLEEIVEKMLAKNRDERYQTSKDLLIDLKRLRQSLDLKAGIERHVSAEGFDSAGASDRRGLDTIAANAGRQTGDPGPASTGPVGFGAVVRSHRAGLVASSILVLIAGIAAIIYATRFRSTAAPGSITIKSLAVLPLRSFDNSDNYLGIGIADAIIRKISQSGEVTVRPTSAVLKYLKADTDSLEAARQLNADAVLEGNTQRTGDRVRVSVNLLRVSDGSSLWADSFDMSPADIFIIQDRVAQQVATRLELHLDFSPQNAATRYPTKPIAYEFFVKGLFSLDERGYSKDALEQMEVTIDLFKKAIEADPNYALAHAELAWAYAWTAFAIEPGNPKWNELAREEINRAQQLGPDIAETHLARAMLLWSAPEGYKNEDAIKELLVAKRLNPNSGHGELAALFGHIGLEDSAKRELQRALEIDPTSMSLKDLALILPYLRGDPDAWYSERQKSPMGLKYVEPWYYIRKGRLDDAQKAFDVRSTTDRVGSDFLMQHGVLWALKGNFQEAEKQAAEVLSKISPNSRDLHHSTYDAACIYALAGDAVSAVNQLKVTATMGFPNYPLFARDPFLNRIRNTPEFTEFLADQKAQWEKFKQEFGD